MTDNRELPFKEDGYEVDPSPFVNSLANIRSVELVPDGNNPKVVLHRSLGRLYLVEVKVTDVTGVPFYSKPKLLERLAAWRKKNNDN